MPHAVDVRLDGFPHYRCSSTQGCTQSPQLGLLPGAAARSTDGPVSVGVVASRLAMASLARGAYLFSAKEMPGTIMVATSCAGSRYAAITEGRDENCPIGFAR